MQARLKLFRNTLEQLQDALKSFQESNAKFKILTTIDKDSCEPTDTTSEDPPAKTLFILDSSFNPPSIAHRSLAETALQRTTSDHYPKPHRLLLLFSTMNADKAPSPASFDQRLTMMSIFASDLLASIIRRPQDYSCPYIDVGVTTAPYYTDKSEAITREGASCYSGKPKHVHLLGYDTLTRVFAAKYYKDFDPPFSALSPYFDAGHEMRATLRPGDDFGSLVDQKSFLDSLRAGELAEQGGKPDWAKQVHLVPPNPKAGVSSTKIRKAAKLGDWDAVRELCTPTVALWVQDQQLYADDNK